MTQNRTMHSVTRQTARFYIIPTKKHDFTKKRLVPFFVPPMRAISSHTVFRCQESLKISKNFPKLNFTPLFPQIHFYAFSKISPNPIAICVLSTTNHSIILYIVLTYTTTSLTSYNPHQPTKHATRSQVQKRWSKT